MICVTVLFLFCSCFFFLNIYEIRIEERIYSGTSLKVIRTVSEVPMVYNSISEIRTPLYIFWLSSVSTIDRFLHCTCAYITCMQCFSSCVHLQDIHTHAYTPCAHTHTHTHARTRMHTHTHTHTHAHCNPAFNPLGSSHLWAEDSFQQSVSQRRVFVS